MLGPREASESQGKKDLEFSVASISQPLGFTRGSEGNIFGIWKWKQQFCHFFGNILVESEGPESNSDPGAQAVRGGLEGSGGVV